MRNFTFVNKTEIIFGKGQSTQLSQKINPQEIILLLYGGGSIKKNGVYNEVKKALASHNIVEFGGVEPNPSYETLMKAVKVAREEGASYILAVGGGSVIDGAKFVAAAVKFQGEPWDILAKGASISEALPIGVVLTLPATGSESNSGSVVTRKETKQKLFFGSEKVAPQFAILDPTHTYSLPPRQIANGIVDAFAHTIEQYMTFPVEAHIQDRFSEGILSTLMDIGPRALNDPKNYDLRSNLMWSATMALNGLIGVGVPHDWATHMIGHELTALYGLDHGQTLAVVLPAVLEYQKEKKKDKILQFAQRVLDIHEGNDNEIMDKAISSIRNFFESLGVRTRLSDYSLPEDAIGAVARQLELNGRHRLGEHGDITIDVAKKILDISK